MKPSTIMRTCILVLLIAATIGTAGAGDQNYQVSWIDLNGNYSDVVNLNTDFQNTSMRFVEIRGANDLTKNLTQTTQEDFDAGVKVGVDTTTITGSVILSNNLENNITTALWHLNDGSGTTAVDATINQSNLAITAGSGVWSTDAKFGAYAYDFATTYMTNTSFVHGTDVTVEFWIKLDTISIQEIVWGGTSADSPNFRLYMLADRTLTLAIVNTIGTDYSYTSIPIMSVGGWTHIAVVVSSSGGWMALYVNGTLTGNKSFTGTLRTNANIEIGRTGPPYYSQYVDGKMDEIRVSKKAVYTTNFTPQTSEFTFNNNYVGMLTSQINDTGASYTILNMTVNGSYPPQATTNITVNLSYSLDNVTWYTTANSPAISTNGTQAYDFADVEGRYIRWNATLRTNDTTYTPTLHDIIVYMERKVNETLNNSRSVSVAFNTNNSKTFILNGAKEYFPASWLVVGNNQLNFTPNTSGVYNPDLDLELLTISTAVNDHWGYAWKNTSITTYPINGTWAISFSRRAVDYYNYVYLNGTLQSAANYTKSQTANSITFTFTLTKNQSYLINVLVDFRMLGITAKSEYDASNINYNALIMDTFVQRSNFAGFTTYFNGTDLQNIWDGDGMTQVNVSSSGYGARNYFLTISAYQVLTAYLLPDGSGTYIRFHVKDTNGNELDNVLVGATAIISGSVIVVDSGYTDASGTVRLFLNPTTTYTITAIKSAYTTGIYSIMPTTADYYLTLGTGGLKTYATQADVSWTMTPRDYVPNGSKQWFYFVTYSASGVLSSFWMNLTYVNDTGSWILFNQTMTGQPKGGQIATLLDLTNRSGGRIVVNAGYTATGSLWSNFLDFILQLTNNSSSIYAIPNIISQFGGGLSMGAKTFIAITIATFLMVGVMSYAPLNSYGGGMVVLTVLGFFTFFNWVDFGVFMLTGIVVVALYVLRRSI